MIPQANWPARLFSGSPDCKKRCGFTPMNRGGFAILIEATAANETTSFAQASDPFSDGMYKSDTRPIAPMGFSLRFDVRPLRVPRTRATNQSSAIDR